MTDTFCYSCGGEGCGHCDPNNHPIAWLYEGDKFERRHVGLDHELDEGQKKNCIPLVPKREWVGLNWDDLPEIVVGDKVFMHGAKWAEAKLKEKNT